MTAGDDHVLARDLAVEAGRRLLELRAQGGEPDLLRKAGDRLSHEFLTAALAARRPGDVVLLSPGGTSYDMFKDFEERGTRFRQLVLSG